METDNKSRRKHALAQTHTGFHTGPSDTGREHKGLRIRWLLETQEIEECVIAQPTVLGRARSGECKVDTGKGPKESRAPVARNSRG